MSDTRTIYLKNNSGTIYSSDPSNVGYEYLDMSGFDSLNPSENSIFTSATNISLMYASYDVKMVLTFMSDYDNGRQARAEWIAKNQNNITQISVANTNNPDLIFSKQAKIKTIDFIENPYVNGVQAELTLELAGRWQSSIKRTSATVYPYSGGTKKYTYKYRQQKPMPQTNPQGQINQLFNTEFSPDLQGWRSSNTPDYLNYIDNNTFYNGSRVVHYNGGTSARLDFQSQMIPISDPNQTFSFSVWVKGKVSASVEGFQTIDDQSIGSSWIDGTDFSKPYEDWTLLTINNKTLNRGEVGTANYISFTLISWSAEFWATQPMLVFDNTVGEYVQGIYKDLSTNTYKYGYQVITDEVITSGYNGFIINIPSQTTPVNVTLTAPSGLSVTLTTSQVNVPLQISSDMIGYSLDNFDNFTLLNKGFPASKYWDNLLSVYSTIQTILNANKVTVSVASSNGSSIPFEFYLYKLQDLI